MFLSFRTQSNELGLCQTAVARAGPNLASYMVVRPRFSSSDAQDRSDCAWRSLSVDMQKEENSNDKRKRERERERGGGGGERRKRLHLKDVHKP